MGNSHGNSIKSDETHDALRNKGLTNSKATAKTNGDKSPPEKSADAPTYDDWTRDELIERAEELGITGRWDMSKDELIDALGT